IGAILAGNMISRLFLKLREELGLVYSVAPYAEIYADTGLFAIVSATHPDKLTIDRVKTLILKELDDLSHNLVSDDELKSAIDFLLGRLHLEEEQSSVFAEIHGQSLFYTGHPITIQALIEIYKSISPQEILQISQLIFRPEAQNV